MGGACAFVPSANAFRINPVMPSAIHEQSLLWVVSTANDPTLSYHLNGISGLGETRLALDQTKAQVADSA